MGILHVARVMRKIREALRVRDDVRNLRPLMGDEVEQEEVGGDGNGDKGNGNGKNRDGGNGNRGNGNGNGNGAEYGYNFRGFMLAREALNLVELPQGATIRNEARLCHELGKTYEVDD
ncbi:hypothetical protein Tco_0897429 [Tanacetum coccineum]